MNQLLLLHSANDYARDIGAPLHHPHVSVIHYDEMGEIRHTLNRFEVYGIFVQQNFPSQLTYGVGQYAAEGNALLAYAPGQIGGKADDGTVAQYRGWVLLFDAEFVHGTEFERHLNRYHYFSYNSNEALRLTPEEMQLVGHIMSTIREELIAHKPHADRIVQDYILLLADLCNRFYDRQFQAFTGEQHNLTARFEQVLHDYYQEGRQRRSGVSSVRSCAEALFMSPGYFGDVVRKAIGQSPLHYIHHFVVERAKMLLASGKGVKETAEALGFEYPQHFGRLFKKETGMLPSKYVAQLRRREG